MAKFNNMASIFEEGVGLMLHLLFFEEDGVKAVYAPALDLFGYGNTEDEAKESFQIVLDEFIQYSNENNTLESELERLGWQKTNESSKLSPPSVAVIIEKNPVAANIYNSKNYSARKEPLHAF